MDEDDSAVYAALPRRCDKTNDEQSLSSSAVHDSAGLYPHIIRRTDELVSSRTSFTFDTDCCIHISLRFPSKGHSKTHNLLHLNCLLTITMRLLPCSSCGPGPKFLIQLILILFYLGFLHWHTVFGDDAQEEENEERGLGLVQETVWKWISSRFLKAFVTSEKGWPNEDEEVDEGFIVQQRWHLRSSSERIAGVAPQQRKERNRRIQLLEEGALQPLDLANFTTAGLRIAPPYTGFSNCFYYPKCANITTNYGTVSRCKNVRVCEVCKGQGSNRTCQYFVVTGNPGKLGARTPFTTNPVVD